MNRLKQILIVISLCGLAVSCGVRGPLEAPPGASPVQQQPAKPGEADQSDDETVLDGLIN